ncbi:unnamed protein product, partial [Cylicostephanus goldi]
MPASSRSNALANLDPSQFSEDIRALIEKAKQPRVNPCPRGKTPQVAQVPPKSKNGKAVEVVDEEMVVDDAAEAPTPVAAGNEGDSMEDVLSMMRATPKRAAVTRRNNLTSSLLHMVDDAPRRNEASSAAEEVQNATYSVHKDGTYTIPNADASNVQPAEVSAPANATFTVSTREVPESTGAAVRPTEQKQVQDEVSFAVPAIPRRRSKNASKTTLQEREERLNTSHKKNMSLLEAMDVDVPSPGRALFAARPLKKPRTLAKTPVRSKQPPNDDTMEVSIVMSDISEQPSVTSDDSSAIDSNSEPRPAQQQTPTHAPVQHTPTRSTGVKVTKGTLGHTPRVPRNTMFTSLPLKEHNVSSSSPYVGLSADARMEIIKNSVERLSRPKQFTGGVCRRANSGRSTPASPYSQSIDEVTLEPVTPFEPIDPSRMVIPDAAKSGTVRRVPKPRNPKN